MRNALLVAHIASVAGWLGANFVVFVLTPWFARRSAAEQAGWAAAASMLFRRYYNVVGTLVAITGVSLVFETGYSFRSGFVMVGIATVMVGALVGVVGFGPLGHRLERALEAGDLAAAARARARTLALAVLDTSYVVLTVLAMVSRWHAA